MRWLSAHRRAWTACLLAAAWAWPAPARADGLVAPASDANVPAPPVAGSARTGGDADDLTPDEPIVPAPRPGTVRGTVRPAGLVERVFLTCRETGETYAPRTVERPDDPNGPLRFAFGPVPGDATYDVGLWCKGGRSIEGIDLGFVDQRLLDLAEIRRRKLGLPPRREAPFTRRDANEILAWIARQDDFLEQRRVLYLRGHGRRATALVEQMRTRAFHASAGKIVWRIELMYFIDRHGSWERLGNQERVLRRLRVGPAAWSTVSVEYDPALSVPVDRAGRSRPVDYRVAPGPDPSRGRPAGTRPDLTTQPHLSGLADEEHPTDGDNPSAETAP
jgi:hypothetical protein